MNKEWEEIKRRELTLTLTQDGWVDASWIKAPHTHTEKNVLPLNRAK